MALSVNDFPIERKLITKNPDARQNARKPGKKPKHLRRKKGL